MGRRISPTAAALLLLLTLCACSVEPRGETVVVSRPSPTPTAAPSASQQPTFEIKKATLITLEDLDQAGYFETAAGHVYGWLDGDHLAAVGVRPVAAQSESPQPTVHSEKSEYDSVSTQGLVGQILSVDVLTGQGTELHTVQDEVILSLGLSHDKTKLWYCSTAAKGYRKLSVSDISFTHELLKEDGLADASPVWSQEDGLLAFLYEDEWTIGLFDGIDVTRYPLVEPSARLLGFWDETRQGVFALPYGLLMYPVSGDMETGTYLYIDPEWDSDGTLEGLAENRLAGNQLLYRSARDDRMYGVDLDTRQMIYSAGNILNFALSDDGRYLCLVRETADGSADVSVGRWERGRLRDEKVVFKSFRAEGGLFFSPDNDKLYMEGRYGVSSERILGMVLIFK